MIKYKDDTYWKEEIDKCANSPYYYFTNYCTFNGEKATTLLTEEEFNKEFFYYKNLRFDKLKTDLRRFNKA